MCDHQQLFLRCRELFLGAQNVQLLSNEMNLPARTIQNEAMQWLDPVLAQQADYHPLVLNEMFIQHLYARVYNPLATAMKRTALLPDQNELRIEDLGIKKPYKYDQHAPDIFRHKEIIAGIVKNKLPGNQKSRYARIEPSIYVEQQELVPIQYREPLAGAFS